MNIKDHLLKHHGMPPFMHSGYDGSPQLRPIDHKHVSKDIHPDDHLDSYNPDKF